MNNKFSAFTYQALKNAGWDNNRNSDIRHNEACINSNGMDKFPQLFKFLSEFGGLRAESLLRSSNGEYTKITSFITERGSDEVDIEELLIFLKGLNCSCLAIIGYKSTDWAIALDESDMIYMIMNAER